MPSRDESGVLFKSEPQVFSFFTEVKISTTLIVQIVMNKGKKILWTVALASVLCVIWAIAIESYGMAALLVLNVFISLYFIVFKMK